MALYEAPATRPPPSCTTPRSSGDSTRHAREAGGRARWPAAVRERRSPPRVQARRLLAPRIAHRAPRPSSRRRWKGDHRQASRVQGATGWRLFAEPVCAACHRAHAQNVHPRGIGRRRRASWCTAVSASAPAVPLATAAPSVGSRRAEWRTRCVNSQSRCSTRSSDVSIAGSLRPRGCNHRASAAPRSRLLPDALLLRLIVGSSVQHIAALARGRSGHLGPLHGTRAHRRGRRDHPPAAPDCPPAGVRERPPTWSRVASPLGRGAPR